MRAVAGLRSRRPEPRGDRAECAVAVYCGAGASHSWTWLVDSLEEQGFVNIEPVSHEDIRAGVLAGKDVLAIGGGDPYPMAEEMAHKGAEEIKNFVRGGGLYLGFCAGTYLLMDLAVPPFPPFNMTTVTQGNLVGEVPLIRRLPTKAITPYGDDFVVHPARGRMHLEVRGGELGGSGVLDAPLYGGPPLAVGPEEKVLAWYHSFTPETVFLVDRGVAASMLLGRPAVSSRSFGEGELFLFGPHLEHPEYPEANRVLGDLIGRRAGKSGVGMNVEPKPVDRKAQLRLKEHLGDARIVAFALEFAELSWKIGYKYYEPAKIPVFLEAMWCRLPWAASSPFFQEPDTLQRLEGMLREVVLLLRGLKRQIARGEDGRESAERIFPLLRSSTALFLRAYFEARRSLAVPEKEAS